MNLKPREIIAVIAALAEEIRKRSSNEPASRREFEGEIYNKQFVIESADRISSLAKELP